MGHPPMEIRKADESDVRAIVDVLDANRADRSLFQQPEHQVRRTLGDFIVATGDADVVAGCAALHWHTPQNAEILAVAVSPDAQGKGVGGLLMKACISLANAGPTAPLLWLATAKPDYFARFGFQPVSRFRLPAGVLWTKFRLVFQQPVGRWAPALAGRHMFMVQGAEGASQFLQRGG
jgi:amino-acid N-acetyltransferase